MKNKNLKKYKILFFDSVYKQYLVIMIF
jgi:hypothetical protein